MVGSNNSFYISMFSRNNDLKHAIKYTINYFMCVALPQHCLVAGTMIGLSDQRFSAASTKGGQAVSASPTIMFPLRAW